MSFKRIAFVTCADLSRYFPSKDEPLLTHDDAAVARFLRERGHQVFPLIWDHPNFFQQALTCDAVVVRSPWDYMETNQKRDAFARWLTTCEVKEVPLFNSAKLMRWSMDKRYLGALEAAGAEIVPTKYLGVGEPFDAVEEFKQRSGFVAKPCISAAAKDTFRGTTLEEAKFLGVNLERVRGNREFMIQPFLKEITEEGEWSLVYLGGIYSHTVRKRPGVGQWLVQDELGGSVYSEDPPPSVVRAGDRAMVALSSVQKCWDESDSPLYARVDIIVSGGRELLGELELIEPELFFVERLHEGNRTNQDANQLFADGLLGMLANRS